MQGESISVGEVKVSANDELARRKFEVHDLIWESDKSGKW
jgi:hypothetical protein